MPYILELKEIIDADEKYALSPDFLMEMMELNEAWMEAEDETAQQSILSQIKAIQDEILEPIKGYLEMDQIDSISQEAMLQIKEYYYKKKYLDRILAEFR
jgi:molecular chaperone HscB